MTEGGFKSYYCYCAVKAHFKSKTYDLNKGFPKKESFIAKWNNDHFNSDGKLYYIVEQHYPKKLELIYLYSIYQYYNKSFFVADVISDKFQLWEKHKVELKNIHHTLDVDLVTIMEYCIQHDMKLKSLFCDSSILKLNLSPFTFAIINTVFKITENIKLEGVVELERKKIVEKLLALDKFTSICHNYLKDKDWKEIIKQKLRSN